jgi:hypothetical protein
MNKFKKVLLAILGAIDVVASILTPILLVLVFVKVFGFNSFGSYLLYTVGILSGFYKSIKVGWMK